MVLPTAALNAALDRAPLVTDRHERCCACTPGKKCRSRSTTRRPQSARDSQRIPILALTLDVLHFSVHECKELAEEEVEEKEEEEEKFIWNR